MENNFQVHALSSFLTTPSGLDLLNNETQDESSKKCTNHATSSHSKLGSVPQSFLSALINVLSMVFSFQSSDLGLNLLLFFFQL